MGTVVVGIIVFGCAGLALRSMIKAKKEGKEKE